VIALTQLPITQFPNIAPPEVTVTTKYTGANAETCVKAVVTPLERAINGVPGMSYMTSVSGNDGTSVISIVFKSGTDPELAAVNVQNRVSSALDELPQEAVKAGVIVEKVQNSMLLYLNLLSNDTSIDEKFLYNFTDINILPELKRIEGVGFADIMGSREYSMRIWLNPVKMHAYNISSQDIINSLKEQNIEAAPGKVGDASGKSPQSLQYVLKYIGKFNTEEQYQNIIIKSTSDGALLKLKDLAEIELGSQDYDVISKENGKPSAAVLLKQRPGTNANEVIGNIKKRMNELKKNFLIGTFLFMQFFGFSLNLITLFALVLAIGIVVDNAIVVVEAVHYNMEKFHMSPRVATDHAMKEISGAIIAITLVMSAVFIPVSFIPGPTGIFYREFSLTMAVAIILSGVVALTLTPALCVLLLKPHNNDKNTSNWTNKFFKGFNYGYDKIENKFQWIIQLISNKRVIIYGSLIVFCLITGVLGKVLPSGFIPNEDQGTIYANITSPSGATLERTEKVVDDIQKVANNIDMVSSVSTLAGFNVLTDGTGANFGMNLISLKNWDERKYTDQEIIEILKNKTKNIQDAKIEFFTPPPVPGYGNASGFELRILDKSGKGDLKAFEKITNDFVIELNKHEALRNTYTSFDASFPQYMINIDYTKAAQKNV